MSIKFFCSIVQCKSTVSLLIFCLDYLSSNISGVLKSTTISVLLLICFPASSSIYFIKLGASVLGSYILGIVKSSCCIEPFIITQCICLFFNCCWFNVCLSDMRMAIPVCFSFPFVWYIFFYLFTFSLNASLVSRWVSCRQKMAVSFLKSYLPLYLF